MSEEQDTTTNAEVEEEFKEEFKCYIGRVPTKFNEEIVQRNIVEKLGDKDAVQKVELIYPHDEEGENSKTNKNNNDYGSYRQDRLNSASKNQDEAAEEEKEHRGFGFVYFSSAQFRDTALEFGTIKGKRKTTSKKSYSMYLRPYVAKSFGDDEPLDQQDGGETSTQPMGRDVCHLWSMKRCPYGDECKFQHVGEGGCLVQEKYLSPEERKLLQRKRKGKCFAYKNKGKCPKGDDCPFSHDFEPNPNTTEKETTTCKIIPSDQKDCINWKTKGKCRKGDKCPYKHDPELQKRALDKIAKKKRLREGGVEETNDGNKRQRKEKQPLTVRIFGLNYDTTEQDIREFVEKTCGHPIKTIIFPRFEDSGRSKGYCGVYFASPKAAKAAVETCDNAELHGRWLRVQTGKSMTIDAWEGLHRN